MDEISKIFFLLWSVTAVYIGILFLFFRGWFLGVSERIWSFLYKKTNLYIFKFQAEQTTKPSVNILFSLLGIFFLMLGFLVFFGKVL